KLVIVSNTTCQIYTAVNSSSIYSPKCQKPVECQPGYDFKDGKCVPKSCPVSETLVNGTCQKKQCPAGQALDINGQCHFADDKCSSTQSMINGRCTDKPSDTNNPDSDGDGQPDLPPFCEWASEMCQWQKEWQQWSNDYSSNEEKANLDREEL